MDTENVTIRNCHFDGNKRQNHRGSALVINGVNIVIEHNYLHDTPYACVNLGRPAGARNMRILHNWSHNPALPRNFWGAFAFTGGEDLLMEGNKATTSDGAMSYGYDVEPNPHWVVRRLTMRRNESYGGNLTVTAEARGAVVEDVLVQGNWIDAINAAGKPHAGKFHQITGRLQIIDNTFLASGPSQAPLSLVRLRAPELWGNRLSGGPIRQVEIQGQ